MRKLIRLFTAVIIAVAPLHGLTVQETKEMETKVKALVAKNTPAVVSLIGERGAGGGGMVGMGSGVVVSADGLILTAAHVTQGNENMSVIFPSGKEVRCKILGANYQRDVAMAKIIPAGPWPFVEVGDSDKLELATMVVALGHPGGYDVRRTPPVRIGRISSTKQDGFLVSDCTLIGGDSGGPLFDLDGKVVGIHSSIAESLGFNRDAPVNAATKDWDRLLKGDRWGRLRGMSEDRPRRTSERATLGAKLSDDLPNGMKIGVLLAEVQPESPASAAGLKTGDVIVRVAGEPIANVEDLNDQLGQTSPGEKLEVVYRRDGKDATAQVSLISGAEMSRRSGIPEEPRRRGRRNR